MSWRGLGQAFIFVSFLGPLSLVEAALAAPTALALSRLVFRARVHEADTRAVELTGDRSSLVAALRHVAEVEDGGNSPWLGERRYSLFVSPALQSGRWPWLARFLATHPSIESRLETIAADR
jgi:Zn-dependent protease with chaperone function